MKPNHVLSDVKYQHFNREQNSEMLKMKQIFREPPGVHKSTDYQCFYCFYEQNMSIFFEI